MHKYPLWIWTWCCTVTPTSQVLQYLFIVVNTLRLIQWHMQCFIFIFLRNICLYSKLCRFRNGHSGSCGYLNQRSQLSCQPAICECVRRGYRSEFSCINSLLPRPYFEVYNYCRFVGEISDQYHIIISHHIAIFPSTSTYKLQSRAWVRDCCSTFFDSWQPSIRFVWLSLEAFDACVCHD